MEVQYVSHSIANRFENHIELNENLKKYPKLHRQILNHELKHLDGGFTLHDLKLDMTDKVSNWELAMFIFHHPKSLLQFFPFYYSRKKGFIYDTNLILFYIFIVSLISLGIFIAIKI